MSYNEPEPNAFSFNSPRGYCKKCKGLGKIHVINRKKIIPDDNLSIDNGGIHPLKNIEDNWIINEIQNILKKYKYKITDPIKNIYISNECIDSYYLELKKILKLKIKKLESQNIMKLILKE